MNLFSLALRGNDLDSPSAIHLPLPEVDAGSRSNDIITRSDDDRLNPDLEVTEHALTLAKTILDIVAPCLREEERREAFGMFFEATKGVLLSYEEKADRMQRRVKPTTS